MKQEPTPYSHYIQIEHIERMQELRIHLRSKRLHILQFFQNLHFLHEVITVLHGRGEMLFEWWTAQGEDKYCLREIHPNELILYPSFKKKSGW